MYNVHTYTPSTHLKSGSVTHRVHTMNDRKTVYCKDAEVWERVVVCAAEGGISVSQLLLSPFQGSATVQVGLGQMNRIEGKIDLLIPKGMPESLSRGRGTPIYGDGVSSVKAEKTTRGDMVVPFNPQPKKGGK